MERSPDLPNEILDHIRLYQEDPEKAHLWDSTPLGGPGILTTLLLTSVGRRSGAPKSTPLVYQRVDSGYLVVASKKGAATHPYWYLNLQAEPRCTVQVARQRLTVRAREVDGAERERLWQIATSAYPPYDEYQAAAGDRLIPLMVLEPVNP